MGEHSRSPEKGSRLRAAVGRGTVDLAPKEKGLEATTVFVNLKAC